MVRPCAPVIRVSERVRSVAKSISPVLVMVSESAPCPPVTRVSNRAVPAASVVRAIVATRKPPPEDEPEPSPQAETTSAQTPTSASRRSVRPLPPRAITPVRPFELGTERYPPPGRPAHAGGVWAPDGMVGRPDSSTTTPSGSPTTRGGVGSWHW